MSIEDAILEAVRALPDDKKLDVLQLANKLRAESPSGTPLVDFEGAWSDLGIDLSKEDIDDARREMWKNFPRDDIA